MRADELNALFTQYFSGEPEVSKPEVSKKAAKKASAKKAAVNHSMSDSESDTDDTSVASCSPKTPAKKAAPVKREARKPSGKGKDAKPRDEQTAIGSLDLSKKKLPELKEYARERGLPVSGTKAQVIENILEYEKQQDDSSAELLEEVEDLGIEIRKPRKTKAQKLCEPATKKKYTINYRHNLNLVNCQDGFFVLNDQNVVIGWVHSDHEASVDADEMVDVCQLQKHHCEMAKELDLEYEVPDNLDD